MRVRLQSKNCDRAKERCKIVLIYKKKKAKSYQRVKAKCVCYRVCVYLAHVCPGREVRLMTGLRLR